MRSDSLRDAAHIQKVTSALSAKPDNQRTVGNVLAGKIPATINEHEEEKEVNDEGPI
jgi:hypothetical protein